MNKQQQIIEQGILPLFYHDNVDVCIKVVNALYDAGIRIIEFTNRGKNAFENFKILKSQDLPGLRLAVGTIKKDKDAIKFMNAGAEIVISPGFDSSLEDVFTGDDFLWIPGCMTPTEIMQVESIGITLIKLFPGDVLGTKYLSAIKPLFPALQFIVTGGVKTSAENLSGWFNSGAAAVGIGSQLISDKAIAEKKYDLIKNQTIEVLETIKAIRKTSANE